MGGNVFSANKAGPYLKGWGRGSNPRTQRQTEHRNQLVQFSKAWQGITAAQRDDWDVYAALPAQELVNSLGENYFVSGFSWFITLNIARQQNSQTQLSAAPVLAQPAASELTILAVFSTASAGVTNILVPGGSPNIDATNVIKAQMSSTAGAVAAPEIRTFMLVKNFGVTIVNFGFKGELLEAFGTAQKGQTVFCTLQIQNTEGRRGPLAAAQKIITV